MLVPVVLCLRMLSMCLGLLSALPMAGAASELITSIEIAGNRRIAAETIRDQLSLRVGDAYDAARGNAALKALFATGHFADVRIVRAGSRLVVSVVEHTVVRKVAFEGHAKLDEKALRAAAALETGSPLSRIAIENAKARIRDAYRARAQPDAAIEARTSQTPDGRVDVVFSIREGAVAKVEHVEFEGNRAFGSDVLRDVVSTRPAGIFDFLSPVPEHDEMRLELDREQLLRHYRSKGFADVEISRAISTRVPSTGGWRVTFRIDEGQRYRFGPVTVATAGAGVPDAVLRQQASGLRQGDAWSTPAVEAAAERMTLALIERREDSVDVVPVPRRDPIRAEIALEFAVRPAQRPIIERIDIVGNLRTKDVVIRRELMLTDGDRYHALLAARARKRLLALGLFKTVEVRTVGAKAADRVVVEVAVVEQDSRDLGFGAGYSSSEGVIGDITLTERNLLGNGQYLRLMLAGSERRAEGELSFTEPYFLGYRLAAGFDLFYRSTDNTLSSSYKSTRVGGDIRLGFEIAEDTRANVKYTLTRNTISDVGPLASAAIRQAVSGSGTDGSASYYASVIGTAVTFDTRDRVASPMRGVYISAGQDLAGLGGDVRYLKSSAEARGYLPVGERTVLATRAIGGTISGWGGNEVRLLDMFYKGGETVRGFDTGGIGPRDTSSANRDALGGTSFIATSAELRAPLPFTPSDFGLRAAVFADAGSLWGTSKSVKSVPGVVGTTAALRTSVGAGLIWDSPVGPLRVDYATPLVKQPFDKTQPLRFGLVPF